MPEPVKNGNDLPPPCKHSRIVSLDYVRVLLTLSILIYHMAADYKTAFPESASTMDHIINYTNGPWGPVIVTMFFMLSGIGLYHKHKSIDNVWSFYYKRWKSIIPLFYIVYVVFYINHCFAIGHIFYKDPPLTILLTILGMDCYSGQNVPLSPLLQWIVGGTPSGTYYLTGTWFLGPILIVYLLYPLILILYKKLNYLLLIGLALLYFLEMRYTPYDTNRTIIYCLVGFVAGMIFIDNIHLMKDWRLVISSIMIATPILLLKLPSFVLYPHIIAFCILIISYNLWEQVSKKQTRLNMAILKLSTLSFSFFLIHIGTNKYVKIYLMSSYDIGFVECVIISTVFDLLLSVILYKLHTLLIHSKYFLKFEDTIIRLGSKKPIMIR